MNRGWEYFHVRSLFCWVPENTIKCVSVQLSPPAETAIAKLCYIMSMLHAHMCFIGRNPRMYFRVFRDIQLTFHHSLLSLFLISLTPFSEAEGCAAVAIQKVPALNKMTSVV